MSIEIVYEQVMQSGNRACKIVSITGVLEYDKLPHEYTYPLPYMYMDRKRLLIYPAEDSDDIRNVYCIGDIISPEHMQRLILEVAECSKRLDKINERIRKDALEWEHFIVKVVI